MHSLFHYVDKSTFISHQKLCVENTNIFDFFFQTPTPSADNSPDNSGPEDLQDGSDSEGLPKFRNSVDLHQEDDANANENIPMNGTVTNNTTKEEINDNDDFDDDNNADPQRLKGFNVSFFLSFILTKKIVIFYTEILRQEKLFCGVFS